jgi:hypothetical protein
LFLVSSTSETCTCQFHKHNHIPADLRESELLLLQLMTLLTPGQWWDVKSCGWKEPLASEVVFGCGRHLSVLL